ncbi:hypothetical protein A4G19_03905 [Pasteurellaceae bacterium Macca]|nr:hypothetical protein [Pasteurellaceae bacterium Macca]
MIRVEFKEHQQPGYALVIFNNWKGNAEIEIAIQRNQDSWYLAEQEQWNSEPVWHQLNGLSFDAENNLAGEIGPTIIDPLLQQVSNVRYMILARDAQGNSDRGVLRMVGNILSSSASGNSEREDLVHIASEPEPEQAVEIESEIVTSTLLDDDTQPTAEFEPEPEPVPPMSQNKSKSKLPLIIAAIIALLALLAVAVWFLLFNKSDKPTTQTTACEISTMGNDELGFIQKCLKNNPEKKQLLQLIEQAKEAKQCSLAQRIYANKAQGGDVEIALAYAKEYDPAHAQNHCFQADKETAIYWYEVVLTNDPNNQMAQQRLQELKK